MDKPATPPAEDPFSQVRWIAAADNLFGVDLLDCRGPASSMLSFTQNPQIAEAFAALRCSLGEEYRGKDPEDPTTCACDLTYRHSGATRDGPLFKAEAMEDKWDIYLYDGNLYFARSWSGHLEYRAAIAFPEEGAKVTAVTARKPIEESEPGYSVAAVDFLIRSHLYRQAVPHPLPKSFGQDPRRLALFSFLQYGRYGFYGTFADTTRLSRPGRDKPGT